MVALHSRVILLPANKSIGCLMARLLIIGARFCIVMFSTVLILPSSKLTPSEEQVAETVIFDTPSLAPLTLQLATLKLLKAMLPKAWVKFSPDETFIIPSSEKLIVALQLVPSFPSIVIFAVTLNSMLLFFKVLFKGFNIVTLAS